MASSSKCARCGAPLEPTAQGLTCPACLIKAALEESADTISTSTPPVSLPARSEGAARPERIGPYTILEQLGEGGMGVVYLAEQSAPIRRRVALKLIKLGMDTHQVVARFEAERQALALMDHPNIASVFDAGATEDGRPFFVMEYVPGVPITEFCDRRQLSTRARLELFQQVCGAVQHAHQKGVIHRDLKPSNVLVIDQDGRPSPKVIDFGIAKATGQHLTEKTLFTEHGLLVGTPEYMSPEQADAGTGTIDTRTDIYSLGILLYELLVGGLPFAPTELRRAGYAEIQRIIREQEAPKPSTRLIGLGLPAAEVATRRRTSISALVRELRGDLDWITLKAIEKAPSRRYASASELAADIGRHLHDEPVLAGPPGMAYRLKKFVRKNRGAVAAGVALVGLLTIGLVASTTLYVRAERSKREADRQRTVADQERAAAQTAEREAERQREAALTERAAAETERAAAVTQRDEALYQTYRNALLVADLSLQAGDVAVARRQLEATDPQFRGWEWRYLSRAADSSSWATPSFAHEVRDVRFSAAGDAVFARAYDVYMGSGRGIPGGSRGRPPTLTATKVMWGPTATTSRLTLGERIIAISPDGTRALTATWNTSDFAIVCRPRETGQAGIVCQPGAPRPGQEPRPLLASEERDRLVVRDTATGRAIATLTQPNIGVWTTSRALPGNIVVSPTVRPWVNSVVDQQVSRQPLAMLSGQFPDVLGAVFSADGTRLAVWSWDNVIHVWDLSTPKSLAALRGHEDGIRSAAFDPTGTLVISTSFDRTTRMWSVADGAQLQRISAPAPSTAAFSPNGERLAIGTDSGLIQVLQAASGGLVSTLRGHSSQVSSVAFSPDSSRVVSGAVEDRIVRLWRVSGADQLQGFIGHEKGVLGVAFSSDGSSIASGSRDGTVRIWQSGASMSFASGHTERIRAIAFAAQSSDLFSAAMDRTVRVWKGDSGELTRTLALDPERPGGALRNAVALSMRAPRVAFPFFRPSEGAAREVWSTVLDVSTGRSLVAVGHGSGQPSPISQIAISPDGSRLAYASRTDTGGTIRVWRVPSGRSLAVWKIEGAWPLGYPMAFSPNGRRIAVTTDGRPPSNPAKLRGKLFVFEDGRMAPVAVITTSQAMASTPVFAPDGSWVAFGEGAKVRLWDLASQVEIAELVGHDGSATVLSMSPDGARLATAGDDNTIRIWDVARHALLLTIRLQSEATAMTFSADGTRLAAGLSNGRIYVWNAGRARAPGVR